MNLLSQISPEPLDIVRSLAQHGYEAYIVGGAVRDLLLGAVPKDYDITTSATPEEIRAVFGRRSSRIIGRRFRLVHVYAGGSHTIYEVSTFRRQPDSNERRGKKSDDGKMIWNDNVYGTLEDDATRRDFTVNALYLDVMGDGKILDFSHGQDDLKRKIVRVIGDPAERWRDASMAAANAWAPATVRARCASATIRRAPARVPSGEARRVRRPVAGSVMRAYGTPPRR